VSFGQGEKIVLHFGRSPTGGQQIVAFQTIGRKACLFVVGIRGGIVIIQVTTGTIVPDPLKLQSRHRLVALRTIQRLVHARQRESIVLVQVGDIVYHPVVGSMATRAICAYRLLVHVGVTGNASGIGFGKNQGFVTSAAVNIFMLALEFKIGFTVMETQRIKR